MKIQPKPLDWLIPYARNPRDNKAAVDKVAASIQEFGFRQPIVVDKDRVIVAGHTRYLAAQKLGLAKVPVHIAEELTPAQIKAYRLADNRSHEDSVDGNNFLKLELEDLDALEFDLAGTGFTEQELKRLFDDPMEPLGDAPVTEPDQAWSVIVDFDTEAEQAQFLDRMETEGISCKALM